MNSKSEIRFFLRKDIDVELWDRCVDQSGNELIYAHSWYLDGMASTWDGLIAGNYEAVMPLPWRRKWGIHYLYPPDFTGQLGIFSPLMPDQQLVKEFLEAIPRKFLFLDLNLNAQNPAPLPSKLYQIRIRKNFVLPLTSSLKELYQGFNANSRRNIQKSLKRNDQVVKDVCTSEIRTVCQERLTGLRSLGGKSWLNFQRLTEQFLSEGKAINYGVRNSQGKLLAGAVFFLSKGKAYYLFPGITPEGRVAGSGHRLLHEFIQDHAGLLKLLDFEGSDIASIAQFYKSFGAQEQDYPQVVWNRLPLLIRWIKNGG
ncbi:MAG: hypothetical protein ACYCOO_01075 [Chitinophagaceae bacterium]